jgi:hypothetical protein
MDGADRRCVLAQVIHALDPDVYVIYQAPATGTYSISLRVIVDEEPAFNRPRWRESGVVAAVHAFPRHTPWPIGQEVSVDVSVRSTEFGEPTRGVVVETEPNNSLAQAQQLRLLDVDSEQIIRVTGGADDIEYFDNGLYGESGDDWFCIGIDQTEPRLLSVNLMPTDPLVAGRVRCYTSDGQEYIEGKHLNETAHEQVEEHRTAIVRVLKPGGTYFLRVEANSPGYDLEVRVRRPAPFSDVREAMRLAMYDHIAQVSAWLMNRPRGNSLDRRIRDTGSLYGTNCMSCHTQSGVWGPAGPVAFGYRIENPLHFRHLMNVMYESLRPTNVLRDAANNTSLAPHDLGDGPAGTRVAGHNVLTAEAVIAPRKLHAKQQIRTANYVLHTSDPSGINAAGKGSNVGRSVVMHYAAEILRCAWDKTGETRYLEGILQRAAKILKVKPEYTDDIAHRILFFRRVFPHDHVSKQGNGTETAELFANIERQLERDELALRRSQRLDGAWGFAPGRVDSTADPAPTALAIDALQSLGADRHDPAIARAVPALLAMQRPYGLWNGSARTGFVTTSYVMHSLSRLYPDEQPPLNSELLQPTVGESIHDRIARVRMMAQRAPWSKLSGDPSARPSIELAQSAATDENAPVRYWAMIALGNSYAEMAVPALLRGLADPVKMVREAARWGLRQTLLHDQGWELVLDAYGQGSDLQREQFAAALIMRADAVMSGSRVDFARLASMLGQMMSSDPHPAVRAWAARAAWNWWVWNPPMRSRLNQAYLTMLQTPEPCHLAEQAKRYQTQALLIANGNRASANYDNPYTELSELFRLIGDKMSSGTSADLFDRRLTAVAATYYSAAYGANGTGQLGYATPGASDVIGRAIVNYWKLAEQANDPQTTQLAIEASANVIHAEVQQKLLHYATQGPESLRSVASSSLSDPRAILLPTSREFVEPLIERIVTNAETEEGRRQASRNTVRQLSQARWNMPSSEGRQREFFSMLIPKLDDPSSDAQWFVAEQLGTVLATNPDFRTETLLSMVPTTFASPLQEAFWLPSAGWMLAYDTPIPELGQSAFPSNRSELRRFALDFYLRNLAPDADRRLRAIAVSMLYQPPLYSNDEVIAAARQINVGNFKDFLPETFLAELRAAIAEDASSNVLELTPERLRNLGYFRDFVIPELNRVNREDGNSCFTCHGGGKIPSMSLEAPDRRTKYLSPRDLWTNYRTLLDRIDRVDVQKSKVLRKPLNIQTGAEDGHQGGLRYKPGDRAHEILKRWVYDSAQLN